MKKILIILALISCKNRIDRNIDGYKNGIQSLNELFTFLRENKNLKLDEISKILDEIKKDESEEANINRLDENGKSLLHYACELGDQDFVDILLKNKIDINIKNGLGETALHFLTCLDNSDKMIEHLLDMGAYINSDINLGNTPLHNSCLFGNRKAFDLLVKRGADIQALTAEGYNLLHCCIVMGKQGMLKKLLKEESFRDFIEKKDFQGFTPLHLACELKEKNCVATLLKYNASLTIEDSNGYNPLQIACISGAYEIVESILETNPSIFKQKNSRGESAIDIAIQFNFKEIKELIAKKFKEAESIK